MWNYGRVKNAANRRQKSKFERKIMAKIVIDGQRTIKKIAPNTKIRIRKANSHNKFIRFSKSYYKRLRKKILSTVRTPIDDSPEE